MQPLREYLSVEGWKRDWAQTKRNHPTLLADDSALVRTIESTAQYVHDHPKDIANSGALMSKLVFLFYADRFFTNDPSFIEFAVPLTALTYATLGISGAYSLEQRRPVSFEQKIALPILKHNLKRIFT